MNKFKVIHEGKVIVITAQGWIIGIGGYFIFFNDKNETVAIAPPTALIGNNNSI
jgi:hypothetical protein